MHILYFVMGQSDDSFQRTLAMLDLVPQYWIPMLNPIVTMLTVKHYRLRVSAIFGLGNRVVPSVPMAAVAGTGVENTFIRRGLRADPVVSLQTS